MKKLVLTILITFVLSAVVLLPSAVGRAQGEYPPAPPEPTIQPTPDPLRFDWSPDQVQAAGGKRAAVNQQIDNLLAELTTKQNEYREANGKFFQGKPTHRTTPRNTTYPDAWTDHPTDQGASWKHLKAFNYQGMMFSTRIDTLIAPEGHGWLACFRMVDEDGAEVERCEGYGPGAAYEYDWRVVQP